MSHVLFDVDSAVCREARTKDTDCGATQLRVGLCVRLGGLAVQRVGGRCSLAAVGRTVEMAKPIQRWWPD